MYVCIYIDIYIYIYMYIQASEEHDRQGSRKPGPRWQATRCSRQETRPQGYTSAQGRAGQDKAGHGGAGLGRAGQGRAGQFDLMPCNAMWCDVTWCDVLCVLRDDCACQRKRNTCRCTAPKNNELTKQTIILLRLLTNTTTIDDYYDTNTCRCTAPRLYVLINSTVWLDKPLRDEHRCYHVCWCERQVITLSCMSMCSLLPNLRCDIERTLINIFKASDIISATTMRNSLMWHYLVECNMTQYYMIEGNDSNMMSYAMLSYDIITYWLYYIILYHNYMSTGNPI